MRAPGSTRGRKRANPLQKTVAEPSKLAAEWLPHRLAFYLLLILEAALLWNTWWGDPLIYLSFVRNPLNGGELSAAFTSPVWMSLTLLTFGNPLVFRLLAFAASLAALRASFDGSGGENEIIKASLIFPLLSYGLMGYETALAVLLVLKIKDWKYASVLLPLVRPEAIFISLFARRDMWKEIVGALGLWLLITFTFFGTPSSILSRAGNLDIRYLATYWTFAVLLLKVPARFTLVVLFLAAGLPLREVGWANRERAKGYDFDIITLKEQAETINGSAPMGATLLVNEIQIRYHLRRDITVKSRDGLMRTRKEPTIALVTDRDGEPRGNGISWEINRPGFVHWVEYRR